MKLISILILFFNSSFLLAQSKDTAGSKALQDKIKQAQQQLNNLTPEQKKLMEQMGISTNIPSMPGGITGNSVYSAMGGDSFSVPAKNATLIAAIPKITLTAATLPSYIKSLNDYIEKGLAQDAKFTGEQAYTYFKQNKCDAQMMGNEAIGFWTMGYPAIAVYISGKACADDLTDDDLLSNFASMLSMSGAPHEAIPLLEYLSKLYPDNTTILNNLGQAWFYLGETDKANAQLDKVVKAFAYHPQANYTQCLIEVKKGNTAKAIDKMKNALSYSYSPDKINMLRKLGYKIKASDMRMPFRPDPNPLGLQNFKRPDVPTSYADEMRLSADWDAFINQLNEKSIALGKELIPFQQANAQKAQQLYGQYNKNEKDIIKNAKTSAATAGNIYAAVAEKKLEDMEKDGGTAFRLKKAISTIDSLRKDFAAKDEAQRKKMEKDNSSIATNETELAKKGESIGFGNCVVQEKYSEWMYATYNRQLEDAYRYYLQQVYLKLAEELYWKQFIQDTNDFEATKIAAKKEWLSALANTRYIATDKYGKCTEQEKIISRFKLADFDDMHCAYITTLEFPGLGKQSFACGRSLIELDLGKFSGKFNFKNNDKGDLNFEKATLEATVINISGNIKKGPLQVGAQVKAGVGVEFDRNGITDVYATGKASVNVQSNFIDMFDEHISEANNGDKTQPGMGDAQLSDQGVEIGVQGKISLISGISSTNVFVNTPN